MAGLEQNRGARRRAARAGVLLAGTVLATALGVGPAAAQSAQPAVVSVFYRTEPALPATVLFQVVTSDAEQMTAANPTPTPLVVTAPDGSPFLRLSAAGVDLDAAAPFTYESRHGPDTRTTLPAGVAPGAPPRWTHVTDDVSWHWYDPRLRPTTVSAPGGRRSDARQQLSEWTVPMRYGDTAVSARGGIESRPSSGWFRTVADPAPAGTSAVVTDGAPPTVILQSPDGVPVTVLGVDGEEFLRHGAQGGWDANQASRTYLMDLVDSGLPVPAGTGWRPFAAPGPVSWSDERLRFPADVDTAARIARGFTDVGHWAIPLRIGDRPAALTGTIRYTPRPGADSEAAPGPSWRVLGMGGAVVLLAAALGGLTLWNRRRTRGAPAGEAPSAAEPDPTYEGAPR
jgi:hypothetical protein